MATDTVHALLAPDGRELLTGLRCARSARTRTRGLLGRTSLEPQEALAFRERAIHMLFMRMPLDIVFCDADLRVLRVVPRLAPWRMAACRRARWVLELAPGDAERLGIAEGDLLGARPAL